MTGAVCVWVASEHQLVDIEAREPVLHPPADLIEDRGVDRNQVARDQDRLIEDLVALPGFQGQSRRRHRALDLAGDPGMHLTRQRDRPIGRDTDGRTPDVEFAATAVSKSGGNQRCGDGQDRKRRPTQSRCQHSGVLAEILVGKCPGISRSRDRATRWAASSGRSDHNEDADG